MFSHPFINKNTFGASVLHHERHYFRLFQMNVKLRKCRKRVAQPPKSDLKQKSCQYKAFKNCPTI